MIDESHAAPKDEAASGSPIDDRVLFFERAGVHEDVAESIFADASHQVQFSDTDAELTRVRLVPSSRVEVDGGFQVLADTTIQVGKRSVVLGSVVTVEEDADSQVLKGLIIRNL